MTERKAIYLSRNMIPEGKTAEEVQRAIAEDPNGPRTDCAARTLRVRVALGDRDALYALALIEALPGHNMPPSL